MSSIDKLILSENKKQSPLSKDELQFNKLLSRVQKAEKNIADTRQLLDSKMLACMKHVQPIHTQWCELKVRIVQEIARYVSENKLSDINRQYLAEYVYEIANEVRFSPHGLNDGTMNQLQEVLEFMDPEEISDFQDDNEKLPVDPEERAAMIEVTKDMLRMQFGMMGQTINLDDLTASLSDVEIASLIEKKFAQAEEGFKSGRITSKRFEHKSARKKTKAQLKKEAEKEAFDELKDKSFSSLYKNLVKLIHPDTEIDEAMKVKKSEWMKRLTVAYKNKDIKTLLMIEMEWLTGAREHIHQLSEEKLKHFNQMLAEQARNLEMQAGMLYNDPRYRALIYYATSEHKVKSFNATVIRQMVVGEIRKDEMFLSEFTKTPAKAKKMIKEIIAEKKQEERENDEFDEMFLL